MNFRKFVTSSGKEVLAGKSAENNEELVKQIGKNETVLHTAQPGSPFVNIKLLEKQKTTKEDIKEAAVFCARYSQDWRDSQDDVLVHIFLGKDIFKLSGMKLGTFGVKKYKEMKVKKLSIEKFEEI